MIQYFYITQNDHQIRLVITCHHTHHKCYNLTDSILHIAHDIPVTLLQREVCASQPPSPVSLCTSFPSGNHLFILCVTLFLFVMFICFLDYKYKWSHSVFVFHWLISLNRIPPRSIHVIVDGKVSFLFMTDTPLCIYTTSLSVPLLVGA